MFLITKCRNGFLLLPSSVSTASAEMSNAFYLASVPADIEAAFKAEEDAQKLRSVRPELVNLSKDMAEFPVLTDTHMAA